MKKLRRNLHRGLPARVLLAAVILLALTIAQEVLACWNTVISECFDTTPIIICTRWPFARPTTSSGRSWAHVPSNPNFTWGMQNKVYNLTMCGDDHQALWCAGCPSGMDPEFDNYPNNFGSYVTYGPFTLATAQAARMTFYLYNLTEAAHDSIFWGASTTANITAQSANIAGSYSGIMLSGWEPRTMDFTRLHNFTSGDSVSMLGQPVVYVFFYFISDNNGVTNTGSFIDNVTISWDDGGVDIRAGAVNLRRAMDSSIVVTPQRDDSAFAYFNWTTCTGGAGQYAPFHVTGLLDADTLMDTLVANAVAGMNVTLKTPTFFLRAGDHAVHFVCDSHDEVAEVREDNNAANFAYTVSPPNPPPTLIWITPSVDTLFADSLAIIRWSATDTAEQGTIRLYYDTDDHGCNGVYLPPSHPTLNGPDSMIWNVYHFPNNRMYYIYAHVIDSENDTCEYAPWPMIVRHPGGVTPVADAVPTHFFLTQNYPNPFNPTTDIRYGVSQGGKVTLRVFDLLGREQATLVNDQQTPGVYQVPFDGSNLTTGIYLYRLTTPEGSVSRKMMLVK
jgi:hypothetical protein